VRRYTRSRKRTISWQTAPDINYRVRNLVKKLDFDWIKTQRIKCFRSTFANTSAVARIWGLGRLWQITLKEKPIYIIEVISEKYDRLSDHEKDKILIHELAHIPKNFSGALLPHRRRGKGSFYTKLRLMIAKYEKKI
jgi:predicted metallopeptidase